MCWDCVSRANEWVRLEAFLLVEYLLPRTLIWGLSRCCSPTLMKHCGPTIFQRDGDTSQSDHSKIIRQLNLTEHIHTVLLQNRKQQRATDFLRIARSFGGRTFNVFMICQNCLLSKGLLRSLRKMHKNECMIGRAHHWANVTIDTCVT